MAGVPKSVVRVTASFCVPVSLELDCFLDEEGCAQITGVHVAHIQGLSVEQVNEALGDDDWEHLHELVAKALTKKARTP